MDESQLVRVVEQDRGDLQRARSAYEAVQRYAWEAIDVDGSQARIDDLDQARQRILAADDRLQALQQLDGM